MQETDKRVHAPRIAAAMALCCAPEHPALSTDPRVLCAAARACKAWQQAVQQCRVCNMHVVLDWPPAVPQIQSFSSWLHTHAALVRSIQLTEDEQLTYQRPLGVPGLEGALLRLQQALQAAALGTAAGTADTTAIAAAAAAAANGAAAPAAPRHKEQQQPQQQQLRQSYPQLASFSIGCPTDASVLAALPAHSLTQLDLNLGWRSLDLQGSFSRAALSAALVRMTNLQQLRLHGGLRAECLAGVAQLTQLSSLTLGGTWSTPDQPLQQLLALPLPLRQLRLEFDRPQYHQVGDISVAHLTSLTELAAPGWFSWSDVKLLTHLPAQLQALELGPLEDGHLKELLRLQQLQRLSFRVAFEEQESLLRLTQLPALQELQLTYEAAYLAAANAPTWRRLPQLRQLIVEYNVHDATVRQLDQITAGLAAASSLTKLLLVGQSVYQEKAADDEGSSDYEYYDEDDGECPQGSLCSSLAGLSLLQDLSIICGPTAAGMAMGNVLAPDEVQALTALTGLTQLQLVNGEHQFGGNTLSLVRGLPQLRHLELESFETYSGECMAAIGRMAQLTWLRLAGFKQWPDEASQQHLLQLAGLPQLRRLYLSSSEELAGGVLDGLRASLVHARVRWCEWVHEAVEHGMGR
uniref:Uncharacterized protein n=1 Tax=Tetradesmus obliquus TaxID=3088 RepID=A0A383VQ57_TETOB|eukprot:jgi/Sobl393_1/13927/SZX66874.1